MRYLKITPLPHCEWSGFKLLFPPLPGRGVQIGSEGAAKPPSFHTTGRAVSHVDTLAVWLTIPPAGFV